MTTIKVEPVNGCMGNSLINRMLNALSIHFPQLDIYYVSNPNLKEMLLKIESNSPEVKSSTKKKKKIYIYTQSKKRYKKKKNLI